MNYTVLHLRAITDHFISQWTSHKSDPRRPTNLSELRENPTYAQWKKDLKRLYSEFYPRCGKIRLMRGLLYVFYERLAMI